MSKKISVLFLSMVFIILCCTAVVSSTSSILNDSGGEVILWESFEDSFPPENWTNTGWEWSSYGDPYHGNEWAYSWYEGDKLTTPLLEFEFNTTLTFWYKSECIAHPMGLEVLLDDEIIWYDYYSHNTYEMATIDLSNYAGEHTIGFRGQVTSFFYGQLIDAITVTTIHLDVNQSTYNRGFPIRHAVDGDWAAAQSFIPTLNTLASTEIYMRKFGTPEFNLTVELREDHPQGTLIDTVVFTPGEIASSWTWLNVDFDDVTVTSGTDYFIVCPPAPSGVTTSFGYEWGYAFGNQYDGGSFWFTRDGGALWRDLPTMYEFAFRTYGYT